MVNLVACLTFDPRLELAQDERVAVAALLVLRVVLVLHLLPVPSPLVALVQFVWSYLLLSNRLLSVLNVLTCLGIMKFFKQILKVAVEHLCF